MNRWVLYAMAGGTATFGAARMLGDEPVNLQATTPGTAQVGHLNITGTARAGSFRGNGNLLTGLSATAMTSGVLTLTGTSSTYMIRGSNNSGAANATGVIGLANSPTGITYGGWFESKSSSGRALFGYASGTAGATYGVYGVASGNGGRAVFGLATNATGNTYGGWFQSNSPDGIGAFIRNVDGGIGLRAESSGRALDVKGKSQFNNFVGIGPRTTAIGTNEVLGLSSNEDNYTGAFVSSGTNGLPYYGYSNGNSAYHFLEGTDWKLYNGGERLTVSNTGAVTISHVGSGTGLTLTNTNTGMGMDIFHSNGASAATAMRIQNFSLGLGLAVQMSNAASGATAIEVNHGGAGHGIVTTATTGIGLWGVTNSTTSSGILGDNALGEAIIGRNRGVSGIAAIVGRNDGSGGVGVRGFTTQNTGIGVLGQNGFSGSVNGYGVRGDIVNSAGAGVGVFGQATGGAQFAIFANGSYGGTGSKYFVIDHPNDPTNKMLMHYCTEGNQPLNAYSGNAKTDAQGYVWVILPDYIEEINKDFRYQLTVINNDDFVMAMVSKEIEGNRFQIRTSKPNVKVSWRVEGVRNDKHIQKFGIHDVVEKPEGWKGKYLRPELYDMSPDRGVFYLAPPSGPLLSDQPVAPTSTYRAKTTHLAPAPTPRPQRAPMRIRGSR